MKRPSNHEAISEVAERLAGFLHVPINDVQIHSQFPLDNGMYIVDAIIKVDDFTFLIEYKHLGSAGNVAKAVEQLKQYNSHLNTKGKTVPLLVVPHMTNTGQNICKNAEISWIDLSGNSNIRAEGLIVVESGKPNKFVSRGRPESLFSSVSSRVSRHLLMHHRSPFTQRDISKQTGVGEGYVSKICERLEKENYIIRLKDRRIKVRDPNILLDAWRESYHPVNTRRITGHIPARSGTALLQKLVSFFAEEGREYAVTGLAAAWLMTEFTAFRSVVIYCKTSLRQMALENTGFVETDKGANVSIIDDYCDEGTLLGLEKWKGIYCVHPIQVYLDLKGQPERADEASTELRKTLINWK